MTHSSELPRSPFEQPERETPANLQQALGVEYIDTYRDEQWQALGKYLIAEGHAAKDLNQGKMLFLANELPKMKAERLSAYGMEPTSEEYPTYSRLIDGANIDPFDPMGDNWNRPNDTGVTPRDRYKANWEAVYGQTVDEPATDDTEHENDDDAEPQKSLEELQADIDTLQGKVDKTFAKRMKVGVFRRKKKRALQAELDEQQNELTDLITERNQRLVEQLRSENLTDEQIAEKLAEQANAEINKQGKGQRKAMIGDKWYQRQWNEVNEWYANASTKQKLGAGALLGLAVGAAGTGIVAASAAGVVVGGVGLAGVRAVRTYQLNKAKLYKTPETPPPIEYKNGDEYRSVDDVLNEANTYYSKVSSERIEKADKIKRRAVFASMGAIALGGTIAAFEHADSLGAAAGWVKDRAVDAKDHIGGWFGSDTVEAKPTMPSQVPGPETPPPTPSPAPVPDIPRPTPEIPQFDVSHYPDAELITPGEGWFQTFGEMGITNPYDQTQLLNNDVLMAKLSNMGVAYPDASIGGWGMNLGSGKLPPEALKLIHDTAAQSHMSVTR